MKNLDGYSFIDEKQKENIIVGYNLNFNMTDLAYDTRLLLYDLTGEQKPLDDLMEDVIIHIRHLYVIKDNRIEMKFVFDDFFTDTQFEKHYHGKELETIQLKAKLMFPDIYSYKQLETLLKENIQKDFYIKYKQHMYNTFKKIWKGEEGGLAVCPDGHYYYVESYDTVKESKRYKDREKNKKEFIRYVRFLCTI